MWRFGVRKRKCRNVFGVRSPTHTIRLTVHLAPRHKSRNISWQKCAINIRHIRAHVFGVCVCVCIYTAPHRHLKHQHMRPPKPSHSLLPPTTRSSGGFQQRVRDINSSGASHSNGGDGGSITAARSRDDRRAFLAVCARFPTAHTLALVLLYKLSLASRFCPFSSCLMPRVVSSRCVRCPFRSIFCVCLLRWRCSCRRRS